MRLLLILIVSLTLSNCDYTTCDLTVINLTQNDYYFYTHPYQLEKEYKQNFAIKENISNDMSLPDFYYEFDPNKYALPKLDTIKDCITNTSFQHYAKQYGGLTIVLYKRDIIETKIYSDLLENEDIFLKIDLTYTELENLEYTVIVK